MKKGGVCLNQAAMIMIWHWQYRTFKQSQVARKFWGQPCWLPKHIQFLDYHKNYYCKYIHSNILLCRFYKILIKDNAQNSHGYYTSLMIIMLYYRWGTIWNRTHSYTAAHRMSSLRQSFQSTTLLWPPLPVATALVTITVTMHTTCASTVALATGVTVIKRHRGSRPTATGSGLPQQPTT